MNSLLSNFTESPYPPHAQPSQQIDPLQGRHDYGDREGDSSGANLTHSQTPLSQMSAIDEWGIAGMLAIIRSDDPNVASLARGQDLTTLGLNLNSAEYVVSRHLRNL